MASKYPITQTPIHVLKLMLQWFIRLAKVRLQQRLGKTLSREVFNQTRNRIYLHKYFQAHFMYECVIMTQNLLLYVLQKRTKDSARLLAWNSWKSSISCIYIFVSCFYENKELYTSKIFCHLFVNCTWVPYHPKILFLHLSEMNLIFKKS